MTRVHTHSILNPSQRVATSLARCQAELHSQGGRGKIILPVDKTPSRAALCVASRRGIIRDDRVVNDGEGGILVDGKNVAPAARLRFVSRAGIVALRIRDLNTLDGSATITTSIVFDTAHRQT